MLGSGSGPQLPVSPAITRLYTKVGLLGPHLYIIGQKTTDNKEAVSGEKSKGALETRRRAQGLGVWGVQDVLSNLPPPPLPFLTSLTGF